MPTRKLEDGACARGCSLWKDCHHHFNKHGMCPDWALEYPLKVRETSECGQFWIQGKQPDTEKVYILTQHLQFVPKPLKSWQRHDIKRRCEAAAKLYKIPERMMLDKAKEQLRIKRW